MRKMLAGMILLVLSIMFFAPAAAAATSYVPDNFGTIQAALDGAAASDEIIVRDGYYVGAGNKDLDFKGKALTLRSENGSDACFILCQGDGRGFYFHTGETSASVVDGFSIIGGNAPQGGGIYCSNSSPTITNCSITGNEASAEGGGIYFEGSTATITNCSITANSAASGGGLYYNSSPATVSNCSIIGNSADVGGGISSYSSGLTITNCSIAANTAVYDGGGIYADEIPAPVITDCSFIGNSAASDGGGIYYRDDSEPTLSNCSFTANTAVSRGGGIFCGIFSIPTITNCSITANTAGHGGGIFCSISSMPTITNCILWNDLPDEIYEDFAYPSVTYSDIEGGYTGTGNIDADPLFSGDGYHLTALSPCIDAGTDAGVYEDIEGDPRPLGMGYDMGCDEYAAPTLTQMHLLAPADLSVLTSPPTFSWTHDGGANNAYAVDVSLAPDFLSYYSTYEHLHTLLYDTTWTMTDTVWNMIPPGATLYWRVRGADLDVTPLTIITSDEVWWFRKQ